MALNDKERAFVSSYLKNWSKTAAAIDAGYSAKTAGVQGHECYNRPHVKAEIQLRMKDQMGEDEALMHLAAIARGKWSAGMEVEGNELVVNAQKVEDLGLKNMIKEIRPGKFGTTYKFPDRIHALTTILKTLDVLKDASTEEAVNALLVALGKPLKAEKPPEPAVEEPEEDSL